ncbi:uncharacterized protein EDB91DRAFT_1254342 [Suillus paluster]|uniref:uncharacterized protein n=1 Tax=Suillus paluster TaxID=48578 RepID=UPI001B8799DD|nr:uncharacterized protein EDB91DRAFT_1254342 [Suillus paluster]KAG1726439.1 hypothetical protein EDB91DRAFT_1254342 [Suillus paluster]
MKHNFIDGTILQFYDDMQSRVICTVCPKKSGVYHAMELRFAQKHAQSDMHTCHANNLRNRQTSNPHCIVEAKHWTGNNPKHNVSESGVNVELESFGLDFMDGDNCPMETDSHSAPMLDSEISLSEYSRDIVRKKLASGDIPFSMPLAPIDKEHELCDYGTPDFGIDIFDYDPPATRHALKNVSPDISTYPWPLKAVCTRRVSHKLNIYGLLKDFVTALLFSSPRLPFSDTQKKAVLNWAKELGAQNVPSLDATVKTMLRGKAESEGLGFSLCTAPLTRDIGMGAL